MEQNPLKQEKRSPRTPRRPAVVMALSLIAVGVLILLYRQRLIEVDLYRLLLPGIVIGLGIVSMLKRHLGAGVLLAGIGLFFLIPRIFPEIGWTVSWSTLWPFLLILLGIVLLLQMLRPGGCGCRHDSCAAGPGTKTDDGFVEVNGSFAGVRHIVLDPVFRGARIRTTFSGTILDLKHTTLAEGDTFIDIDTTLSGLELHLPDNWTVVTHPLALALAGVEDKRFLSVAPDPSRRLVLRGSMTLSGVEIKS